MPVWSWVPQRALEATLTPYVQVHEVSPGAAIVGFPAVVTDRAWRVEYTRLTRDEAQAMYFFVGSLAGGWRAFSWSSPIDSVSYLVRLATPLALTFDGDQYAARPLLFVRVPN